MPYHRSGLSHLHTSVALFDTTSRARAATDGPCWRTSRESHPSEDLSELPPQSGFSLGRSIITRLPMRVGLARNQPQCETARHRLLFGRMGTAQHLHWPSLMQILSAQVVLAHPPASLQPTFWCGLSSADVSCCRIFGFQGTFQSFTGRCLSCTAGKFCEDALHDGQIFTFQVYHELSKQDFLLW